MNSVRSWHVAAVKHQCLSSARVTTQTLTSEGEHNKPQAESLLVRANSTAAANSGIQMLQNITFTYMLLLMPITFSILHVHTLNY